ncbi:MAG: Nif3-like dinuclear metal center hexameric protein, partial [bacterium]|nr:Nif3-like dinuclear metal center hexameric protein [bacterium]
CGANFKSPLMPTKLSEIVATLEKSFPLYLAEPGDKIGLQIGDPNQSIRRILLTLDIISEVVAEAIKNKVNLIISHHPLIYTPLPSLVTSSPLARMITHLIEKHIAVYIAHTNLDFAPDGTTRYLANLIGLQEQKNLIPFDKPNLKKLVVFVPTTHLDHLTQAIFDAGAGVIGNYSECSFRTEGTGTFRAGDTARPFIGEVGKLELAKEIRFETIVPGAVLSKVITAMINAHPYEEVAYDIYPLDNPHPQAVVCLSGKLAKPIKLIDFAKFVKKKLKLDTLRIVGNQNRRIQTAAVVAGSGMSFFDAIKHSGVDVFLTGDVKYHQAQDAELHHLALLDIGHYPSEGIYLPILKKKLAAALPQTVAISISKQNQNPFKTI